MFDVGLLSSSSVTAYRGRQHQCNSSEALQKFVWSCRMKVQQLVQQRLAEQFNLMGGSLGLLPAAGALTLEAAAAAHDVALSGLDADVSDDEDAEDDLTHQTPPSGNLLCPFWVGTCDADMWSGSSCLLTPPTTNRQMS